MSILQLYHFGIQISQIKVSRHISNLAGLKDIYALLLTDFESYRLSLLTAFRGVSLTLSRKPHPDAF